ncbi:transposable element Tcb1 transposase [Trichonephila clavipes]|nr:transposable element Tcb1 transposase [Trichonephila clavipes]
MTCCCKTKVSCHSENVRIGLRQEWSSIPQNPIDTGFFKKRSVTSRRKQRSAFDLVSDFDKGRIVAYKDCGLSFMEIGSRVGRNRTTVMRINDRWIQEGTTGQRGRSHPPQCTTSPEDSGLSARRLLRDLPLTQNRRRLRRQWCDERRMWAAEWNEVVFTDESRICLQHHDGRIRDWRHRGERMLSTVLWSCTGQRYISEVLEPVVLPYLKGLATAIVQQDNARPHVARIVQRFFIYHQIELLPWPARSPDLSPMENT